MIRTAAGALLDVIDRITILPALLHSVQKSLQYDLVAARNRDAMLAPSKSHRSFA
jgi:hypothetical protein